MDRMLIFAFSHQTVIIELIFAIILGIVVLWLFTNIRGESGEVPKGPNTQDIERALKKVLESTDVKVSSQSLGQSAALIKDDDDEIQTPAAPGFAIAGASAAPQADPAEVSKLKAEMENRSKKLAEVETALTQAKEELTKAKAAAAFAPALTAGGGAGNSGANSGANSGGNPGVNIDELNAKIRSLESRLSEYEIIEDDIANLSLYKEENAKLRAEMGRLKGEPIPSAVPLPEASATAPATTATTPTTPPPAGPTEAPIDSDKLVREFDSLVAKEASRNAIPDAPAAPIPSDPAAASTPAATATNGESGEKLIEEFENFVKGGNT